MKIILNNDKLNLIINSYGAYVEEFSFKKNPVFFPKLLIKIKDELKTRGGMHPCLPNFGKSDIEDLDQHGYGRISFWEVLEKDEKRVLFKLNGKKKFENLLTFIEYEISDKNFKTSFKIRNKSEKRLPIAPGFHPYFCIGDDFTVENLSLKDVKLEDTFFIKRDYLIFKAKFSKIRIEANKMNTFAIWTDFHGDYICLEPSLNGPAFSKEINNPLYLNPGDEFNDEINIKILD
ncbi:aldose epimerase [Anaerococcus sp. AGMB00486]|uniref:Aldose epimerase n=2 Tax=Anaerococcus TaxID=165779 RepID=A0ABX2NBL2_9FIRM|nr:MULTISPECIES: aldose epimerase [Anaerococcus]MDY3006615.1 aldose epimerase [Anaerococcus porci]MSS78085.1 aldose epimerase [Anaerococcus porci]NVF12112.1 aldose epimerase [Anaerococcus faecalis]